MVAVNVPVPEWISRKAFVLLVQSLGLDPTQLVSLSFTANGVYAEVFATNEEGKRIYDSLRDGAALHSVYIPVKEDAE